MPIVYFAIYILIGCIVAAAWSRKQKENLGDMKAHFVVCWPIIVLFFAVSLLGRFIDLMSYKSTESDNI